MTIEISDLLAGLEVCGVIEWTNGNHVIGAQARQMALEFEREGRRVLVQAVKRNVRRFPADFMLQLSKADAPT